MEGRNMSLQHQAEILIVDDDPFVCKAVAEMIRELGHRVETASNLTESLQISARKSFDVVFLDVGLPDGSGLDVLPQLQENRGAPEVIIITGAGNPDGAEIALKSGAWDYIEKPLSRIKVVLPLERALQYRGEKKAKEPPARLDFEGIIGSSPQIKACLDLLARAAGSESGVLITGETGTGKELFARAVHRNSRRAERQFVVVDCAALPETLVESNLFGYEKGAFTGAERSRDGLIKQADGGTLFLDEVGELSPAIQGAFLRVLQEHRFRPVGALYEVESSFRLICATNRDLNYMAAAGLFRQDLLYRLQAVTIEIPPLRERRQDIREIALHHVDRICKRWNIAAKGYSPDFFDVLAAYRWPGNARELVNTLEHALSNAAEDPILFPKHLPAQIRVAFTRARLTKDEAAAPDSGSGVAEAEDIETFRDFRESTVAAAEKQYLEKLMARTHGDVATACRISGLSRPRLYSLLKKYEISRAG
jgi:two-component system NtrC family response regulator